MNVQEFDTALSDLETRVDRLRALYENWFRGYEKMEPQVARKDVERRVYGLRKELPRNTALRFRYNQLYQRYTTLATYWQRTARQIEEGTFRLQLQRMKRRRVDDDELMRTNVPPPRDDNDETIPPKSYELDIDESLDVSSLLGDADIDQLMRAIDPGPKSAPAAKSTPTPRAVSAKPEQTTPQPAAPSPIASARFARPSVANDVLPMKPPPGALPLPPKAPDAPTASPVAAKGPTPAKPPPPPPLKIPAPNGPPTGTMTLPNPQLTTKPNGPGTGAIPLPPGFRPAASAPKPPVPPPSNGPSTGPRPSLPVPPPSNAKPPVPPARPAMPVPARPQPVTPTPRAPDASSLSEQRMRRIYDEYVAARRQNNEGEVRYEALAGTIQKMLPDLTKKHQGKQIDFEVVLKDGRVGLKPKAT